LPRDVEVRRRADNIVATTAPTARLFSGPYGVYSVGRLSHLPLDLCPTEAGGGPGESSFSGSIA
jgi:hypothetical protein